MTPTATDFDLNSANPSAAPEPKALVRSNVVKVIKNEITDMPLRLKEKSNVEPGTYVPFWSIEYECLDVRYPDSNAFITSFGSRLFNKHGEPMDKNQRPAACYAAFAGLGIISYPADPDYDESAIIDNHFIVEGTEFPTGRPAPLPVEALGHDYTFTGDVRVLQPRNSDEVAVSGGSAPITTEVMDDDTLLSKLVDAVSGVDLTDNAALVDAIRSAQLGQGLTIGGESLLGVTLDGNLPVALGLSS